MPVEYRKDNGQLVWVRNPFTGALTYFTHVHKKRSGFIRHAQEALLRGVAEDRAAYEAQLRQELDDQRAASEAERTALMQTPPLIIVTSRLADERLWAEVLNLGGFDVLSRPYDAREVRHVIAQAWRSWHSRPRPALARGD